VHRLSGRTLVFVIDLLDFDRSWFSLIIEQVEATRLLDEESTTG
jgi:hypothetical protein